MRLWGLGYYESGPDVQVFADSEVLIIFTCATERLLPLCMHCTHTPLSSRGQMHSFCLNFIADFSLICSPLPFLSGPVVIGLLLHTPSVSENEMSRMHYIPLETHVEQGDSPFFFFFYKWYRIRERKVCQLWNYWSSGSFLFLFTESHRDCREKQHRKSEWEVLGSACVPHPSFFLLFVIIFFLSLVVVDSLARGDTFFDEARHRDCPRATQRLRTLPPG